MLKDHKLLYGAVRLCLLFSKSNIFKYLWSFLTKYLPYSGKALSHTIFPKSQIISEALRIGQFYMSYENNVFSMLFNAYISDPYLNRF